MADTREFSSSMSTPQSGNANLDITVAGQTTNYNPFGPDRSVTIPQTGNAELNLVIGGQTTNYKPSGPNRTVTIPTAGETLVDGGELLPTYTYYSDYDGWGCSIDIPDNHKAYQCTITADNTHPDVSCNIWIKLPPIVASVKPIIQLKLILDCEHADSAHKGTKIYVQTNTQNSIHVMALKLNNTWVSENYAEFGDVATTDSYYVNIVGDTYWVG